MTSFIARSLSRRLGQVFKNIQQDQIDLNFFGGSAVLRDLELDEAFCNSIVGYYFPMFAVSSAKCEFVRISVPWTKLGSESIVISLGPIVATVEEIETISVQTQNSISGTESTSAGNGYTFWRKVIDQMRIDIKSIVMDVKLRGMNKTADPPYIIRFSIRRSSWLQIDENGNAALSVKRITRSGTLSPDSKNTVEEIMVFKMFLSDSADISIFDPKSNATIDVFRGIHLNVKVALKRDGLGNVNSTATHVLVENANALVTTLEFEQAFHTVIALLNAFGRPDEDYMEGSKSFERSPEDEKTAMTGRHESEFPSFKLMDDLAKLSDEILKNTESKTLDSTLSFDEAFLSELHSHRYWSALKIKFDQMTVAVRDGNDNMMLCLSGFEFSSLSLMPDTLLINPSYEQMLENPTKMYNSISIDKFNCVGPISILAADNNTRMDDIQHKEQTIWEFYQDPFVLKTEFRAFQMLNENYWPYIRPPFLAGVQNLLLRGVHVHLDIDQWLDVLKLVSISKCYQHISDWFSHSLQLYPDYESCLYGRFYLFDRITINVIEKDLKDPFQIELVNISNSSFPNAQPWNSRAASPNLNLSKGLLNQWLGSKVLMTFIDKTLMKKELIGLDDFSFVFSISEILFAIENFSMDGSTINIKEVQSVYKRILQRFTDLFSNVEEETQINEDSKEIHRSQPMDECSTVPSFPAPKKSDSSGLKWYESCRHVEGRLKKMTLACKFSQGSMPDLKSAASDIKVNFYLTNGIFSDFSILTDQILVESAYLPVQISYPFLEMSMKFCSAPNGGISVNFDGGSSDFRHNLASLVADISLSNPDSPPWVQALVDKLSRPDDAPGLRIENDHLRTEIKTLREKLLDGEKKSSTPIGQDVYANKQKELEGEIQRLKRIILEMKETSQRRKTSSPLKRMSMRLSQLPRSSLFEDKSDSVEDSSLSSGRGSLKKQMPVDARRKSSSGAQEIISLKSRSSDDESAGKWKNGSLFNSIKSKVYSPRKRNQ